MYETPKEDHTIYEHKQVGYADINL